LPTHGARCLPTRYSLSTSPKRLPLQELYSSYKRGNRSLMLPISTALVITITLKKAMSPLAYGRFAPRIFPRERMAAASIFTMNLTSQAYAVEAEPQLNHINVRCGSESSLLN
jgi:hypothetical protein